MTVGPDIDSGSGSSPDAAGEAETGETLDSFGSQMGARDDPLGRATEWFLVDGDRLVVAASISLGVFVTLLALAEVGAISFANDDSITRMASGMIAGTFSLVTLVVSINQLILSREFTAADETRDRLEGVLSFREDVEEMAAVPASPASPTGLLELLVETIHYRALDLSAAVADHEDDIRDPVDRYVNGIEASTERVDDTLERSEFGTFKAVSAAIGYDSAWQLYVAHQLRGRHEDTLSDEALEAFDELIDALKLFVAAREHFKTTYLQRELTRFSQLTIYAGVPSILSAVLIALVYADLTGPTVSVAALPWVVSALVTVVVSPLALLVAYILRTATVTRRSASIGPMIPQKSPEEGPFDVSYGDAAGPVEEGNGTTSGGEE